jgi:hypothetical protein
MTEEMTDDLKLLCVNCVHCVTEPEHVRKVRGSGRMCFKTNSLLSDTAEACDLYEGVSKSQSRRLAEQLGERFVQNGQMQ